MASVASLWSCLLLVVALPTAAAQRPARYALDPVHTRVLFAIDHAGYSQSLGTVSGSTGSLLFDPDDWSTAQLEVSVPIARFDLGDQRWNRAVAAPSLLDVQAYPVATFVSTRIVPKDPTRASVCGTLQLRGMAREVCLDVAFNQLGRYPLPPFRRTAGFSATATLSRKAFGISAWPGVIGDRVQLRIEAEAFRSGAGGAVDAGRGDASADDTADKPADPVRDTAPEPVAAPPPLPPAPTPTP